MRTSNRSICKKGNIKHRDDGRAHLTRHLITVVNDRYLHDLQIGSAF